MYGGMGAQTGLTVSTHSRPKAAGLGTPLPNKRAGVSTHSRPKAAGSLICAVLLAVICFNSQPPEGGW